MHSAPLLLLIEVQNSQSQKSEYFIRFVTILRRTPCNKLLPTQ